MSEREGVTKYQLEFSHGPPPSSGAIAPLNAWRRIMRSLALTGRDPARYGGLGFGNLSCRVPPWESSPGRRAFLVTGTQTGAVANLQPEHYATVTQCIAQENRLSAHGPVEPSSESLTHGALYAADPGIRWILHAHAPHIWRRANRLGVAVTDPRVPYGTPAMAAEVARVAGRQSAGILSMGGHEDGILAWGASGREAGCLLLTTLARAYAAEDHEKQ